MDIGLELSRRAGAHQVEHLFAVVDGHFAATQTSDEVDHRRPLGAVVERGAELRVEDAAVMWRAEAVIAIDDTEALEPAQPPHDLVRWEGPEPLQTREADLVALLAQTAADHAPGHGDRALTDQHVIGVLGHVLLHERLLLAAG